MRFAVTHNLYFYNSLMQRIRDSLDAGDFDGFRNKFTEILDKRSKYLEFWRTNIYNTNILFSEVNPKNLILTGASSTAGAGGSTILMLVLMFAGFLFLLYPSGKQEKEKG